MGGGEQIPEEWGSVEGQMDWESGERVMALGERGGGELILGEWESGNGAGVRFRAEAGGAGSPSCGTRETGRDCRKSSP